MLFSKKWLRNHQKFLLHFLMYIDVFVHRKSNGSMVDGELTDEQKLKLLQNLSDDEDESKTHNYETVS